MGIRIGIGQGQSIRSAFVETELEAAVGGVGIAELIGEACENSTAELCIQWIALVVAAARIIVASRRGGREQGGIELAPVFKMPSLTPDKGRVSQPILGYLILDLETILHC